MPFKKGISGNPAGRPKRKQDEIDFRGRVKNLLNNHWEDFERAVISLDNYQKAQMFERLLQYQISRMKEINMDIGFENLTDGQVQQVINELIRINSHEGKN